MLYSFKLRYMSNLDTSLKFKNVNFCIIFIYFNSEIYELYEMLYSFKLRYTSNLDTSLKFKNVNLYNFYIFQFRDI